MILEHVLINVAPARAADYSKDFFLAQPLVERQPGCHSCQLLPQVGYEPGVFLLLIMWECKEDHTEGFRKSEDYKEWSRLLHPYYDILPTVTYFQL